MGSKQPARAVSKQEHRASKTVIEWAYKIEGHICKKTVVDDYLGYDPSVPTEIAHAFRRNATKRPEYPISHPSYLPLAVRDTLGVTDVMLFFKCTNEQHLLELESRPKSQSWTDSLAFGSELLLFSIDGQPSYTRTLSSYSRKEIKRLMRRMRCQRNRDTSPLPVPPNSAQRPLPAFPSRPSTNPSDPPSSTPSPTRSAPTSTNRKRPTQARATPARARATPAGATPSTRQQERGKYKYAEVICAAIISSENQHMPLHSIYNWIQGHCIGYATMAEDAADYKNWTGNTRHNLTTHEEFAQINRESRASRVDNADNGKGELWVMADSPKARALVVKMQAVTLPVVRAGYVS